MNNIDFIKKLDAKLRYEGICFIGNHKVKISKFHMNKDTTEYIRMTLNEFKKLYKIISNGNFIITPYSGAFTGGFEVYTFPDNSYIRDKDVCDLCLKFRKDQLPNSVSWNDLKPLLNSKKNEKLLKYYHFNKIESEEYYDY